MGVGGQRHTPAALPHRKDPVPIVYEAGWVPGPVWTGGENLAPTGIRSPARPARSESLMSNTCCKFLTVFLFHMLLDGLLLLVLDAIPLPAAFISVFSFVVVCQATKVS